MRLGEDMGDAMKSDYFKVAVSCLILVSGFGCGNVAGPTDPAPTVQTVTTFQGEWSGTTSEGLAISFTAAGNTITRLEISMMKIINGLAVSSDTYVLNEPTTIIENFIHAKVDIPQPEGSNVIPWNKPVDGSFSSPTSISGTAGSAPGMITWKAEKK